MAAVPPTAGKRSVGDKAPIRRLAILEAIGHPLGTAHRPFVLQPQPPDGTVRTWR